MAKTTHVHKENSAKKSSRRKSRCMSGKRLHSALGSSDIGNNEKANDSIARKKVHICTGPTICNVNTDIRIVASGKSNEELYVV